MKFRSWYGLEAEIDVEKDVWHHVKVGKLPLNHPPFVNLVLRHGLPDKDRQRLSWLHEFGHFQTMPLSIIHTVILYRVSPKPRSFLRKAIWWIAIAVAHQAFWEIVSETYVVANERQAYLRIYRRKSNLLMPLFWGVMSGLNFWLNFWLVRKGHRSFT